MPVKKNGNVLVSTILIFSLVIIISNCSFKMMKNNNQMMYLYDHDGDVYDLEKKEKEYLLKFMKELNKLDVEEALKESFRKGNSENFLVYNKENDKFNLYTKGSKNLQRELSYFIKDKKIILIPTYKITDIG